MGWVNFISQGLYFMSLKGREVMVVGCSNKFRGILAGSVLFFVLILSSAAFSASPFTGIYSGTSGGPGCEPGQFSAFVREDGTFNLVGHADLGAADFLTNFVEEGLVIGGDGTFATALTIFDGETPLNVTISGTFAPPSVSGTISDDAGCTGTFSGTKEAGTGPLSGPGGYYTGSSSGTITLDGVPDGTFSGTVTAIIPADGSGIMVHEIVIVQPGEPNDPLTIGGTIAVDAAGNFSEVLDDINVTGSINFTNATGSGTTSATFVEPEGTIVESGTFTMARQLGLPSIFENDVVVNIPGVGVKVLFNNNTSSTILHTDTAEAIAVGDVDDNEIDDVIVSFVSGSGPGGTGGTFISRNQTPLVLLDTNIAQEIAVGDFDGTAGDDLMLNSSAGLALVLNDGGIIPFISVPAEAIASGDVDNSGLDDLVLSIAGFGTVVLKDFTTLDILDASAADVLAVADVDNNGEGDVVASFPAGAGPGGVSGTYISRNQGALVLLDSNSASQIAFGDLDNSGQEDLLFDFGAVGLSFNLNDGAIISFVPVQPSAIGATDVDSSGLDDMIFGISGFGTTVLKDFATLEILDPTAADDVATGNIDGN